MAQLVARRTPLICDNVAVSARLGPTRPHPRSTLSRSPSLIHKASSSQQFHLLCRSTTGSSSNNSHIQYHFLSRTSLKQRCFFSDLRKTEGESSQPKLNKSTAAGGTTEKPKVLKKVLPSIAALTPHENIYNLPNILTVSRLIAAPATAYLLLHDHYKWALALFAYAGITDLVDGWIARKWKLQTVAGSVIDPMADKALMIILTVTLAVKGAIPLYLATLILGRDASLALAAIYYRYASLPAPKTFRRYWDFSLPSAEVHPTTVSKYNTFLQLILIGSTLALPVVSHGGAYAGLFQNVGIDDATLHKGMKYFQWLVAGTTAWSGLSYAFLKNAVTILGPDEKLKAKQGARGRAIIGVTFGSIVAYAAYVFLRDETARPVGQVEDDVD